MTSCEAVHRWRQAVLAEDADLAWRLTEPAYRRVLAERRVAEAGDSLDDPVASEAVRTFAEEGRDPAAWLAFAEGQRAVFEQLLPEEWRALRDEGGELGAGWRAFARENDLPEEGRLWSWVGPRTVADDCELLQLVDATAYLPEDVGVDEVDSITNSGDSVAVASVLDFYMRRGAGGEWLLAGLGEFPPDWLELESEGATSS